MAKRRSRRKSMGSRPPQNKKSPAVTLPKAAETIGFTELDEEFFRVGLAIEEGAHEHEEPDTIYTAPSFWRRLFSRPQHA